jgi:hypothetical protein
MNLPVRGRLRKEAELWKDYLEDPAGCSAFFKLFSFRQHPFISKKGFIEICPDSAEVGDLVTVFLGGTTPYLISPKDDGIYRYINECYVHGFMDGEVMKMLETGESKLEEFSLS